MTFDCPTCGRATKVQRLEEAPFRPFCSHRCKMIDLGKWFDGTYCVSDPMAPEVAEGSNPALPDNEQV